MSEYKSAIPSESISDTSGWKFYSLTDTLLESRLFQQDGRWVECFKYMPESGAYVPNPAFNDATHHIVAALSPEGIPCSVIYPRGAEPAGTVPSDENTESRILAMFHGYETEKMKNLALHMASGVTAQSAS